ncbi:MAG: hypothetical protein GF393_00305 [Armatimonadia bacterium]|nr:hypothetical protein [Armatimonadia bacterium]
MRYTRKTGRRGAVALGMAFALLLVAFITVTAFMLGIMAGGVKAENALRETQALYAAEAGLDLLRQSGAESLTGECGRARYAVRRVGGELRALGQVERPSGHPVRCAVVVSGGDWRQVPPGQYPELAGLLSD